MNGRATPRSSREGAALFAVVVYVGIVGLLGAAFVAGVNRAVDQAQRQETLGTCRLLAEAGVEKAIAALQTDPAYLGETGTPLGDGAFTVTVEPAGGAYRIVSTGAVAESPIGSARVRLAAEVQFSGASVVRLRWLEE